MSVGSSSGVSLSGISGYDFSGIVDKLVQVESLPEAQMQQQQQDLQTRTDAWRDVNTRLSSLDSAILALNSSTTWTATAATSSNTGLVSVSSSPGAAQGAYNLNITQTAAAQTVVGTVQASATTALNLTGTFNIMSGKNVTSGVGINVVSTDTLTSIASKINAAGAGVNAAVIQVGSGQYKLSISNSLTGTDNQATFQDGGGILNALGLISGASAVDPNHAGYYIADTISNAAVNAQFSLNGINIISQSNTITTAIPGVNFNFGSVVNPTSPQTATLNVTADSSAAQKVVQGFVDQYNSTMDFISQKLAYNSTTKIKGDLFGDATLQGIQRQLRSMVGGTFANATGPYNILSAVGVSTSSTNFGKDATLSFDASKFSAAMAANPQSVANLFGASYNGVTPSTTQGLGNIMHNYLNPMIMYGGSISQTQDIINNQIKDVKTQIFNFEQHISDYQEQLKLKFANLEATLSGFNSQGSWLSSQVSAMSGSTQKQG